MSEDGHSQQQQQAGDEFSFYEKFASGQPMPDEQRRKFYGGQPPSVATPWEGSGGIFPSGFGRMLCLHYFSSKISSDGFKGGIFWEDEEVYPLDSIQEWNDLENTWIDAIKSGATTTTTTATFKGPFP